MEWVFAHMEDPDFNDPPVAAAAAGGAQQQQQQHDPEKVRILYLFTYIYLCSGLTYIYLCFEFT
jgi:uncharacterized UBP type Zn finger protein